MNYPVTDWPTVGRQGNVKRKQACTYTKRYAIYMIKIKETDSIHLLSWINKGQDKNYNYNVNSLIYILSERREDPILCMHYVSRLSNDNIVKKRKLWCYWYRCFFKSQA